MIKTCDGCNQDFLTEADPYLVLPTLDQLLCCKCGLIMLQEASNRIGNRKKEKTEIVEKNKDTLNYKTGLNYDWDISPKTNSIRVNSKSAKDIFKALSKRFFKEKESIFPELKRSVEEVVPCAENCSNFHKISTDFALDGCCNDVYDCPCDKFELEEK